MGGDGALAAHAEALDGAARKLQTTMLSNWHRCERAWFQLGSLHAPAADSGGRQHFCPDLVAWVGSNADRPTRAVGYRFGIHPRWIPVADEAMGRDA